MFNYFAFNNITALLIPPPVKHTVTFNLCFFKSWVHEKLLPISRAGL
jgi:hypothetical protein